MQIQFNPHYVEYMEYICINTHLYVVLLSHTPIFSYLLSSEPLHLTKKASPPFTLVGVHMCVSHYIYLRLPA